MALATKRGKRLQKARTLRIGVDPGGSQAGAYQPVPGARAVSHQVAGRSVQQVTFFGDVAAEVGERSAEGFSVQLGNDLAHTRPFRGLQAADEAGRTVKVRMETYGQLLQGQPSGASPTVSVAVPTAGNAAAAAKGGLVTFTGDDDGALRRQFLTDEILIGDILLFGQADPSTITPATDVADDTYIINRVEYNDEKPRDPTDPLFKVYVTALSGADAAVKAAAKAAFLSCGFRREFTASVSEIGSFEADADNPAVSSGLMLQPTTILSPPDPILYTEARSGW